MTLTKPPTILYKAHSEKLYVYCRHNLNTYKPHKLNRVRPTPPTTPLALDEICKRTLTFANYTLSIQKLSGVFNYKDT